MLLSHLPIDKREDYLQRITLTRYTQYTLSSIDKLREELDKVRAQGYAINDQELEIGLRSIAVPITSVNDGVTAALNVGVQAGHVPLSELTERILPILLEGSQELSLLNH
ncbi:Pca regulon regulatory protein [compost metagenome]